MVVVPFVDLGPTHAAVKARVLAALGDLIDRGDFVNGAAVVEFERKFAAYSGRRCCVGVASGLDALRLSLLAAGLGRGEGVVVPANTFIATFEAVVQAGGVPVVVDATEDDYNLDVDAVEQAAADGARHVLPVHLYGQMADMRRLLAVAEAHRLVIVEDACQAHGATRDGIGAGAAGLAAAFSFYPAKNLGAMGDAGALVTDDDELAARVRAMREHGQTAKYRHEYDGYTARLDTFQAAVLLEKLPLLDGWNRARVDAARFYTSALAGIGDLRLPPVVRGSDPVWHLYVIRTADPEQLAGYLGDRGIATGRHYPEPPHLSRAYGSLGFAPGDFPVSERIARESLSLPMYPGITEAQLEHVCAAVAEYFGRG